MQSGWEIWYNKGVGITLEQPQTIRKRHPSDYSEFIRLEKRTKNPFSQFLVMPHGMSFESQDRDEIVLLLLRRHFITNVPWIFGLIAMLLAPLALDFFPILELLPERFQIITVWFWYLFSFGFGLEQFLSWYFNVYIITDERIIDVDFYNLIYKSVSAAKIDKIEDVTYRTVGTLRSLLQFGTVTIQTAAEKREFEFEDVPNPERVTAFLNELMLEEEREQLEGRVR